MRPYTVYSTYILTNWTKTVLYTGYTNNLPARLVEHWLKSKKSFTAAYQVCYLVWFEDTKHVLNAQALEKQIKKYTRRQKEDLINALNPQWNFLNAGILGNWPPTPEQTAAFKKARGWDKSNDTETNNDSTHL